MTVYQPVFLNALGAAGPSPDRGANMDLYGWLIGSWDLDVTEFEPDGSVVRRRSGEWHFGWVLEGRAIQDVWIVPKRGERGAHAAASAEYYGTTFRVYDPRIDAWHIQWIDPVAQAYLEMVGRKRGDEIGQEGMDSAGNLRRWSFTEITPDRFIWRGEVSVDRGATWSTNMEYTASRVNA